METPIPNDDAVPLEQPKQVHPFAEFVGMFKDDPLIERWKQSMKAYRKARDKNRQAFPRKWQCIR